jgi:hypothetical protein
MDNIVEELHNEELHGEMSYIFEDGVEGFVGEFGSNSMSKERSEKNIVEVDEELVVRKNLNEMRRIITKGMHMGMMT